MNFTVRSASLTCGQRRLLASESKQVLLSGGFGAGKTTGLVLKLLQLRAANPGVAGMLVAPTRPLLFSVTLRRLMAVLRPCVPAGSLPRVRDPQGQCYLDFGDGVPVFLRSATRPDSIDGLDVGWAIGDEIRYWARSSYDILLGRVRVPCPRPQKAFASTPSMGWMSDEFNAGVPGRELINSPTVENRSNLAAGYIENLKLSYSSRLWRAVVEGQFTILEGAVYEVFDSTPGSLWFVDYAYDRSRQTILMVDPGYRRSSWIFAQELTPTSWVLFDEIIADHASDTAVVQLVNARGYEIDEIWVDPAADATQSAFNMDTIDVMGQIKCRGARPIRYIVAPYNRVTYGVDKLRTMLGDPDSGLPIRLTIASKLADKSASTRGVVRSLASYRYEGIQDGRSVTDYPLKDGVYDHTCDAIRMFAVGKWLSSPLRQLDRQLRESRDRGYKIT